MYTCTVRMEFLPLSPVAVMSHELCSRRIFSNHLYALAMCYDQAILHSHESRNHHEFREGHSPVLPPDMLVYLSSQLFGQVRVPFAKAAHIDTTRPFVEAMRSLIVHVLGFLDTCIHHDATASAVSHTRTFPSTQWHKQLADVCVLR